VEALKQLARKGCVGIDRLELVRSLDGIAVDESTARAFDEPKGRMLGECDTIHESVRRGRWSEPAAMKLPQQLYFLLHRRRIGNLAALRGTASDALRDFVRGGSGFHDLG
jgi:hypothetical protein